MQRTGRVLVGCGTAAVVALTCLFVLYRTVFPNFSVVVPAASERARQGQAVIDAIYRYRSRHGLFPMAISDLVPALLPAAEAKGWDIDWLPYVWSLTSYATGEGVTCVVRFTSHGAAERNPRWQWQATRDDGGQLDVVVSIPSLPRAEPQAELLEFERRIEVTDLSKDYPGLADHYQGAISHLLASDMLDAAVAKCIEMHERGLKPDWVARALAHARLRLQNNATAATELRTWAEGHPTFANFVNLADLFREMGQGTAATEALHRATQQETMGHTDSYGPETYLYLAAVMAYDLEAFELSASICDYWEKFGQAQGYAERSYHLIRAAANIALGRFEQARMDANAPDMTRSLWAGDQASVRRAATEASQTWRADFPATRLRVDITYK